MSKTKYLLNDKFDAETLFTETIAEFKNLTGQNSETINQIPLKFLFCFTAGIADAAYYLACCAYQKIGMSEDGHKGLASVMFNVAIMLDVTNKHVAVGIIKDVPQSSFTTEIASNIVTWFREGNNDAYIYQNLLADILDFDQNLVKSLKISLLKNINDSALKQDFICIPEAKEHLGITSEEILFDLTGRVMSDDGTSDDLVERKFVNHKNSIRLDCEERVVSDERLSTIYGDSENNDRQEVSASYHPLTEGKNNSSEIQVELVGEDPDSCCCNCIIS